MISVALALVLAQAGAGNLAIEDFEPSPTVAAPKLSGEAKALIGIDPQLYARSSDPFPPNVFDLRGRLRLAIDVKPTEHTRLFLEGRAFWRGVAEAGLARGKSMFETTLGEAFVDFYSSDADLRVGKQVLTVGAGSFAPADQLSPRDLRWSFLQADGEDVKLPIFAIRAQGERGRFFWQAIIVPFFEPNVFTLFGENESLIQPGLVGPLPIRVDPTVEDQFQRPLVETQRPLLGDAALRGRARLGETRVGASWIWMNEKLPEVTLDPELALIVGESMRGEPIDPAAALSLENRARAGETLVTGIYQRQHLFSLEASRLFGSLQLDLDATFSPAQTFVNDSGEPLRKPTLSWSLSATQAEDSPWLYSLTYLGLAAFDVHANEFLFLVEPLSARGSERTAMLHVLVGTLSRRLLSDRLELGARGALDIVQRSFVVGPRASLKKWQRFTFTLAAELYGGPQTSPFGYFRRNSALWLQATAELF